MPEQSGFARVPSHACDAKEPKYRFNALIESTYNIRICSNWSILIQIAGLVAIVIICTYHECKRILRLGLDGSVDHILNGLLDAVALQVLLGSLQCKVG